MKLSDFGIAKTALGLLLLSAVMNRRMPHLCWHASLHESGTHPLGQLHVVFGGELHGRFRCDYWSMAIVIMEAALGYYPIRATDDHVEVSEGEGTED